MTAKQISKFKSVAAILASPRKSLMTALVMADGAAVDVVKFAKTNKKKLSVIRRSISALVNSQSLSERYFVVPDYDHRGALAAVRLADRESVELLGAGATRAQHRGDRMVKRAQIYNSKLLQISHYPTVADPAGVDK